jgi:hypothetical protein
VKNQKLNRFANPPSIRVNAYSYIKAFDALRTELSQIHAVDPLTTACMKSAAQRLLSWVNNFDVSSHPVAVESAGQLSLAPSTQDPPRWRPMSARENTSDPFPQDNRSPISILSTDCLAGDVDNAHDVPSAEELVNVQGTATPSKTSVMPVSLDDVVSTPRRALEHGMETGRVISNDLVAVRANAAKEQAEQSGLTTRHRDDVEEAQSHQSGEVCDEDELVVANGPQRGPRSNGGVVNPRTKDTPVPGGHNHGLTNANDSSSDVEEDSDNTDPKGNTSNQVRPRAKRAFGADTSISETHTKRRKTSNHFTKQTACSVINNIPNSLIQPPQISQLIAGMLDKSHKHDTIPLTSFFFAIGSPYSIKSFREACRQVCNVQVSGPFPEETGARRSTRALDRIEMHDKVSPILRRYHLVQLVKRRDELQQEMNGVLCQQEPKKLKYGLRTQPPPKALVGPKGAASRALERLMGEAYPKSLQDTEMESTRYDQRFKELKNRLSAGHNWYALQARFGIGIMAFSPVGKEVGVWNSK